MEHRYIVCAACKLKDGLVICGARHWDDVMRAQMSKIYLWEEERRELMNNAIQGFIDQRGNFLERDEAFQIAFRNNQIDLKRNRSLVKLYSEGLY